MIRVTIKKIICIAAAASVFVSVLSGCAGSEMSEEELKAYKQSLPTPLPSVPLQQFQSPELINKYIKASPSVSPKSDDDIIRDELVEYALNFEGYKYSYAGFNPDDGFDCSGLIYYVYRHFGYRLHRVAADQAADGKHIDRDELKKGDIVCFRKKGSKYIGHCGIYLGDDMFLHAMDSAHGVVITSLSEWLEIRSLEARQIIGSVEKMTEDHMKELDELDRTAYEEYKREQERLRIEAEKKKANEPQPESATADTQTPAPGDIIPQTPTPSEEPVEEPSPSPTAEPTSAPPAEPSASPSSVPGIPQSNAPTAEPTSVPSSEPGAIPTSVPGITLSPVPSAELSQAFDTTAPSDEINFIPSQSTVQPA